MSNKLKTVITAVWAISIIAVIVVRIKNKQESESGTFVPVTTEEVKKKLWPDGGKNVTED